MSKKHYVANNTKYYKHSNRSEIDHVIRAMKKNENAFSELTKNNFGFTFDNETLNLKQNYELKLSEAKNQNPSAIQKNSNTFIDSVLVFDHELMHEILKDENGQGRIKQSIKNYMQDFKNEYGFEPVGFQFHVDEGTFYNQKDFDKIEDEDFKKLLVKTKNDETGEDGYLKQNFHAQAIFLNFNKETGKSCLRNMRKQDWRDCQDLLHKHFKEYGFDRGEPKQTAEKDHKNKDDYVKNLKKQIEKLEESERDLILKVREKGVELLDIYDEMDGIAEDSIRFNEVRDKIVDSVKSLIEAPGVYNFFKRSSEQIKKANINVFKKLDDLKNFILNKFEITDEDLGINQKNDLKLEKPKKEIEEPKEKINLLSEDSDIEELRKEANEINKKAEEKAKITKSQANYARRKRKGP
ncbi:hypothetical protein [Vibrio sp. OPT18]|uniref:hypothetical protein n=1 Tax=Vibrio sp. OPT18 TaxID=2778641 RepID=UPI00188215FF|nr:hypothetical protein [Vibrio sp. OPT18]MBE8574047.1 hypothetical protein [Vibrio sp. OPT18]